MYAFSVSLSPCLMLARRLRRVAYLWAPWNWRINIADSCPQKVMVSGSIWRIHFFVVLDNVTVKHWQRASKVTCRRSIWSLKVSRWSRGSVLPSYATIDGILNLVSRGACWISVLNGEVDADYMTLVFLAANLSSRALSSFISSFTRDMTASSSLLPEVAEVRLAFMCVCISSPRLQPSRSNTLQNGLWGSSVIPFSCDLAMTLGWMVRPEAILLWGRDGPASSRLLLSVVADRVDSAWDREICWEFARRFEVTFPHMVVLATYFSTHVPSIADFGLGVGWTCDNTILSNSFLMVWMAWFVSSTIPSNCTCRLATWVSSISVCSGAFSFLGL